MASNSTSSTLHIDRSWTNEAIIALASILVMIILSGLGIACSFYQYSRLSKHQLKWRPTINVDEEVALESRNGSSAISTWGNIDDLRHHQQEANTRVLRTRPKKILLVKCLVTVKI
ncbi:hypothetical protein IQ07DRAFT_226061 [Pyrenochaeta sp. DS3sAY3a]|nr:hypothetical protein IQ07DRAFT_226061 [Pyrenochaeta sp. DS3sAY3a]